MKYLIVLLTLFGLMGCGGGEKASASVDDVTTVAFTVELKVVNDAGGTVRDVNEGDTVTAVATVGRKTTVTRAGRVISDVIAAPLSPVEVEFGAGVFASVSPSTGKVLTDASGVAKATLKIASKIGSFTVTATAAAEGRPKSEWLLQTLTVTEPKITLVFKTLDGSLVVPALLRPSQVYTVEATVLRVEVAKALPQPIVDSTVKFSTEGGAFEPASGIAITGPTGVAKVRFRPTRTAAQYRAVAETTVAGATVQGIKVFEVVADRLFLGSGTPFVSGVIALDASEIDAGGATQVRVTIVDDLGIVSRPVSVRFTSACSAANTASITTPVLSVRGVATATYRAGVGCIGEDVILAEVSVDGLVFESSATARITIKLPRPARVEFVSATPTTLVLRGRGSQAANLSETSDVKFIVLSDLGVPVPGQTVAFAIVGNSDATLAQTTGLSLFDGTVTARVMSGNAPGPLRVIATIVATGQTNQSDVLTVSTGSPDQNGLSLSATNFSPEAFQFDGEQVTIIARSVDRFGNPSPDGTRMQFVAEGGSILPSCALRNGSCSVVWTSQNPRPSNGRVSILVTGLGDESFVDTNGNAVFDNGETFTDLPEAYNDTNENGQYDSGEYFSDTDRSGGYSGGNGKYDGLLCGANTICGTSRSIEIRGSLVIVMATSRQRININPSSVRITQVEAGIFDIAVSDLNGNLPPAGTKITVTASVGTLSGDTDRTVPTSNSPGPLVLRAVVSGTGMAAEGTLSVKVVTPKGVETSSSASITSASICDSPVAPLPSICVGGGTVGQIGANPTRVPVLPNQSAVETIVSVTVRDASTVMRPFTNLLVSATCTGTQPSFTAALTNSSAITGGDGVAKFGIRVTSNATPAGIVTCTFAAGGKQTSINVGP